MIIDSNLVFFDSAEIKTATSDAVALNSMLKPGKTNRPIPLCIKLLGDPTGVTSLALKLTEADSEKGSYTDVPGSSVTITTADIKPGKVVVLRYLPAATAKPWLKLSATVAGSASEGKLFAAVVREDELAYEAGMYIDKGVVVG